HGIREYIPIAHSLSPPLSSRRRPKTFQRYRVPTFNEVREVRVSAVTIWSYQSVPNVLSRGRRQK
ncbi:hypothetical protein Q9L58_003460, partial [Maublancomyces gigas]